MSSYDNKHTEAYWQEGDKIFRAIKKECEDHNDPSYLIDDQLGVCFHKLSGYRDYGMSYEQSAEFLKKNKNSFRFPLDIGEDHYSGLYISPIQERKYRKEKDNAWIIVYGKNREDAWNNAVDIAKKWNNWQRFGCIEIESKKIGTDDEFDFEDYDYNGDRIPNGMKEEKKWVKIEVLKEIQLPIEISEELKEEMKKQGWNV